MGFKIEITNLTFVLNSKSTILEEINLKIEPGQFVAVLGENGAGKTTLLDLLMGFRRATSGSISIEGQNPQNDRWELRREIAYLSEKVDLPGDWTVQDFFNFNKFFYREYSEKAEADLCATFRVNKNQLVGSQSAGELRRAQVVSALSVQPKLIIVDEITAVLDIVGRRRFMQILSDLNKNTGCTVLLATNILEDLEQHASHVLLMQQGRKKIFKRVQELTQEGGSTTNGSRFSQTIADLLSEPI